MNTVRSCLAASALVLFAAVGRHSTVSETAATDAQVCCSSSGGGGGHPVCRYGNRTFHTVEKIGGSGGEPCRGPNGTDAIALLPIRKCCPPDRAYDPETRSCRLTGVGGDPVTVADFRRLMTAVLLPPDRITEGTVVAIGYDHGVPKCPDSDVLVDELIAVGPPLTGRPLLSDDRNCFDLTPPPVRRLAIRTCRPRVQYCGGGGGGGRYTCANKCCKGDRMIGADYKCKGTSMRTLESAIYETTDDGGSPSNSTLLLPYYRQLKCKDRDKYDNGSFKLLANGSFYLPSTGQHVPEGNYCLEYQSVDGGNSTALIAFMCVPEDDLLKKVTVDDIRGSWKYLLNLLGFVPSIVCLSVTLIVYAMLSNLRNVHGYYVMCYVACLLLSFVCLLVIQWMTDVIHPALCKFFGYVTLFSFLTTFCWLNVICFDIYWILRYNNSINKSSSVSIRTIIYNIYCWGFSSACICTAFLFQHSKHAVLSKFAPHLGTRSCWFFETDYGTVVFFILPVSIMLIANLILFVLTAVHCSRIKSELNKFKRTDSKTRRFKLEKEKFVMSVKLFLVMGIPWSFEILSKVFNNDWLIWYISDEINALQGVMVFIIFVAKRKVIVNLRKKIKGSFYHSESTKVNTISGSSQSSAHNRNFNDF